MSSNRQQKKQNKESARFSVVMRRELNRVIAIRLVLHKLLFNNDDARDIRRKSEGHEDGIKVLAFECKTLRAQSRRVDKKEEINKQHNQTRVTRPDLSHQEKIGKIFDRNRP
jgi:hypothetical protein